MMKQKGFTLIELLVVVVVLGVLSAIALPNFTGSRDRASITQLKTNMHTFQTMIETYSIDWDGKYPSQINNKFVTESKANSYYKTFDNPYADWLIQTHDSEWPDNDSERNGLTRSFRQANINANQVKLNPTVLSKSQGQVVYDRKTATDSDGVIYAIYGSGKDGRLIRENSGALVLSNSHWDY